MSQSAKTDIIAGLVFLCFGLVVVAILIPLGVVEPKSIKFAVLAPSYYPRLIGVAIGVLGFLILLRSLLALRSANGTLPKNAATRVATSRRIFIRVALVGIIMAAYYWLLLPLGFALASLFALLALLILAGERSWILLILVPVILPFTLHFFFSKVAGIPIPGGVLDSWFWRI